VREQCMLTNKHLGWSTWTALQGYKTQLSDK